MLDLRRLKVLREVALQRSFSAAATELMFSPEAVSDEIARLEREVGVSLVERNSAGVALTPAGELLVAHADLLLARAAQEEEELQQLGDGITEQLRVGAFASAVGSLMPDAIVAFRSEQPGVSIELVEQDRSDCLKGLRRAELDLAVLVLTPEADSNGGIVEMPLLDDHIDILLPRDHALAEARAVTLGQLRNEPWIECSGHPVRHHMAALGIEPNVVYTSDHYHAVEGIVAAGMALAFMPRLAQPVGRDDVIVKPIVPEPLVRRVGIAIRDGNHQPTAVATMIDILRGVVASRDGRGELSAPSELSPAG